MLPSSWNFVGVPTSFTFSAVRFLQIFRLWVPYLQFEFKRRSFAASPSSSCPSYLQDFFVEFGWIWQKDHNLLSFRRSLWNPKSRHFARLAALVDFVKDIASKWCEAHEKSPNYGNLLDFETFNLYHATFWVIEPATLDYWKEGCSGSCSGCGCGSCGSCASCNGCSPCGSCGRCGGCSYVELVAISTDDQRPKWFVSHAWLEPIVRFMRCLKQHALVRQLSPQSAYWVCASKKTRDDRPQREVLVRFGGVLLLVGWQGIECRSFGPASWTRLAGSPLCWEGEPYSYLKSNLNTQPPPFLTMPAAWNPFQNRTKGAYANNQHDINAEIQTNPRKTSFYRAIKLCAGVLLILDSDATPFTRSLGCNAILSERMWRKPLQVSITSYAQDLICNKISTRFPSQFFTGSWPFPTFEFHFDREKLMPAHFAAFKTSPVRHSLFVPNRWFCSVMFFYVSRFLNMFFLRFHLQPFFSRKNWRIWCCFEESIAVEERGSAGWKLGGSVGHFFWEICPSLNSQSFCRKYAKDGRIFVNFIYIIWFPCLWLA